ARSELTSRRSPGVLGLMKSLEGGVLETCSMFQDAVPALNHPPLSPTRGSGLGAVVDMLAAGDGAPPAEVLDVCAHPAAVSSPRVSAGAALRQLSAHRDNE